MSVGPFLPLKLAREDPPWAQLASGVGWQSLVFLGLQMHHSSLCLSCHMGISSLCIFLSVSSNKHPTYHISPHIMYIHIFSSNFPGGKSFNFLIPLFIYLFIYLFIFKQQKFNVTRLWRLEVCNQGVGRVGFFLRLLSLACGERSSPCDFPWLSSAIVCVLISFPGF